MSVHVVNPRRDPLRVFSIGVFLLTRHLSGRGSSGSICLVLNCFMINICFFESNSDMVQHRRRILHIDVLSQSFPHWSQVFFLTNDVLSFTYTDKKQL